jgi:hypothetical protein
LILTLHTCFSSDSCNGVNLEPIGRNDIARLDKNIVFEGLKDLYSKKVLPLEIASKFSVFGSPFFEPNDFEAKPMVLVLGQYSVGKTSFIRSLLVLFFHSIR